MNVLTRAVEAMGGQSNLARALGVRQQHVWNWIHRRRVPAEHCPAIERETRARGSPVTCEELRPDVDWSVLRSQSIPTSSANPPQAAGTISQEAA